jgi:hypothetical protein
MLELMWTCCVCPLGSLGHVRNAGWHSEEDFDCFRQWKGLRRLMPQTVA